MTWVGYFEDIEESQIESLKRDNRQLEIVGANATLNNDKSQRYLQHAKCYHEAGQKIEHRLLEIVTHPDYSNVLLLSKNKKLQNELSDSNRVILALREELQKIGQEKDKLLSNLQRLFLSCLAKSPSPQSYKLQLHATNSKGLSFTTFFAAVLLNG
jgi:hypothetical protein